MENKFDLLSSKKMQRRDLPNPLFENFRRTVQKWRLNEKEAAKLLGFGGIGMGTRYWFCIKRYDKFPRDSLERMNIILSIDLQLRGKFRDIKILKTKAHCLIC